MKFYKKNIIFKKYGFFIGHLWTNILIKSYFINFDFFFKISQLLFQSFIYFLRDHSLCLFKSLSDIGVYDFLGKKFRFIIVYNFFSYLYNTRLYVLVQTSTLNSLVSIVHLFNGANWLEREVWDMFGIFFWTTSWFKKDFNRL